jgi:wobble nucleotide-excising tRNase
MINKIDYINNFGSYKNFSWTSSLQSKEFNLKNLFYGWNYSGKTTLSRVFSSLRDRKIHDSYKKGSFKVTAKDGVYESSDLENFPYNVLVFNSDYIKDNLSFSIHEDVVTESKTIFFEVGDNAKYEAKIQELKKRIESINGTESVVAIKAKFQNDIDAFEIYDKPTFGKFTLLAREIKDDHFLSLINFTKANLKPIVSTVKDNISSFIIKNKEQLIYLGEIVKVSEPKQELKRLDAILNYDFILTTTNDILAKTPEKKIVEKILDTNTEAYSWVKKGKDLHKANSKCLFCHNTITDERYEFLITYFSSQVSDLKEEVDRIKITILDEINSIKSINFPSSSNDLNLGFIKEYTELKAKLDKHLENYKRHLKALLQKLDSKINTSLYSKITPIRPFDINPVTSVIVKLNELIDRNNNFSSDFINKISDERDRLKNHLVASFLKREKYHIKEKKFTKAISEIDKLDKQVADFGKEITRYESLKESDSEGAEQYTYFIQSFLNRTDIRIELDSLTRKFVLLRDNENASNLSEGEKTAIAFSHFLVSVKALESKNKFKEHVVFVDDPISSLDGNHIFQINSLLKEIFFSQHADPNNPAQNVWKLNCLQLFISTHNFEFFNLLKEMPKSSIGFDYIKNEKKCKESRYFIERKINGSIIYTIPSIFDDYKSEYHFLFSEIVKFNEDNDKHSSEKILIMPNVLRRFVEMYTLTKYPSKDEVDDRANEVFGKLKSKRILKPFHYFSHFNNIDRIGRHSELLVDVEKSCSTLIDFLKTDKKHYEALYKSIT